MNSLFNLILAAAVLFSAAPEQVAKVESLNRCDEYTITYYYQGEEQSATVCGYDFNEPPTVGEQIEIESRTAEYIGRVNTESGELWQFRTGSGDIFAAFTQDLNGAIPSPGDQFIVVFANNGTPETVEDDIICGFFEGGF